MKKYKRMFVIVMDSLGVGQMTDAEKYNDVGADTFGHIGEAVGGLNCPVMQKLGVGNLHKIKGIDPVLHPESYYTKMRELSVGKDTMTGHWEIMGLNIQSPFQTFTDTGFPQELMDERKEKEGELDKKIKNIKNNDVKYKKYLLDFYVNTQLFL